MTVTRQPGAYHLAAAAQRREAVLVGNSTTALWSVLMALDHAPRTPVLLPDLTSAAAVNAVVLAGLRPQFADVRFETAMPTPADLAVAGAAGSAGAMVPTHLFGRRGRLPTPDPECPQILDATQCSVAPGELSGGLAVVTSFGPGDQLDLGGGAAVLTDDPALAREVRRLLADLPAIRHELLQPAPADLDPRLATALPGHGDERCRRRARGILLREAMMELPDVSAVDLGPADVPWRVTFRIPVHRDAVMRSLRTAGFTVDRLFAPLHRLAGQADWEFPRATMLAETLLNCDPGCLGDDPITAVKRLAAVAASVLDGPLRKEQHAGI